MAKKWNFEDFDNEEVWFYGVDNNHFKIGCHVFEAIEDESDGYRSYLGCIAPVGLPDMLIFRDSPLAKVRVEKHKVNDTGPWAIFEGWRLIDIKDNHIWLTTGTNYADDYYPFFVFDYQPKEK